MVWAFTSSTIGSTIGSTTTTSTRTPTHSGSISFPSTLPRLSFTKTSTHIHILLVLISIIILYSTSLPYLPLLSPDPTTLTILHSHVANLSLFRYYLFQHYIRTFIISVISFIYRLLLFCRRVKPVYLVLIHYWYMIIFILSLLYITIRC